MESPPPPPPPHDPPLVISDDEVEQLLQQAETLVDEIAVNAVTEPEPSRSSFSVSPGEMTVEEALPVDSSQVNSFLESELMKSEALAESPLRGESPVASPAADALLAVEKTGELAQELTAILDPATVDEPVVEESTTDISTQETTAPAETVVDTVGKEAVPSDESSPPNADDRPMEDVAGNHEPGSVVEAVSVATGDAPATVDTPIEVPPLAAAVSAEAEAQPAPTTAPAPSVEPTPSGAGDSPKSRLGAVGRILLRIVLAVPIAILNLGLRLIVLLDRPFAGWAAETKLRVGLVGIISLFMGTAVWVLPRMANPNPYADIGAKPSVAKSGH